MKFLLCMTVPLCKNCIHYSPPIDRKFESSLSTCKRIGTIIDDEIEYSRAIEVRENACGGLLYEEEPRLPVKRFHHNLKRYGVYTGYALLYLTIFALTKIKSVY
jgi:hypothetical protein